MLKRQRNKRKRDQEKEYDTVGTESYSFAYTGILKNTKLEALIYNVYDLYTYML